jgi:hypothetical protein
VAKKDDVCRLAEDIHFELGSLKNLKELDLEFAQ